VVKIHCLTYLFNILQDKNGKIENNELHGFVKDLLELAYEVSTHPSRFNSSKFICTTFKASIYGNSFLQMTKKSRC